MITTRTATCPRPPSHFRHSLHAGTRSGFPAGAVLLCHPGAGGWHHPNPDPNLSIPVGKRLWSWPSADGLAREFGSLATNAGSSCTATAQTIDSTGRQAGRSPTSAWRPAFGALRRRLWVGNGRPRMSAVRSLNLGVSFLAVRLLDPMSLADPSATFTALSSSTRSSRSHGCLAVGRREGRRSVETRGSQPSHELQW